MQRTLIRLLDVIFALIGIVCGLPVFALVLVLGYLSNGSPLFFQTRVGQHQQPFTLAKFRTMSRDTQSVGTHLVDSSSITPFGKLLRRSKLDELPQLFNVLLGQMSLVGPRPCLLNQAELIAERAKRGVFAARPGITGLAQIRHIDMSTPKKLARIDQLMIRRQGLCLYGWLLVATILGKGRGDRVRQTG